MRKIRGLYLFLMIMLLAVTLPDLVGLGALSMDRCNETKVGPDPEAALGITGLDGGVEEAAEIDGAVYLGGIRNNFSFPVELEIAVEAEFLEAEYEGPAEPQWQNINIFFRDEEEEETVAEFNFANQVYEDAELITAAERIELSPGAILEIKIDDESFIYLEEGTTLEHFLGVARFYFTGYIPDVPEREEYIFIIEPADDLRKQFFTSSAY